jgi:NDP-sugar pyrophosphorylase family protein
VESSNKIVDVIFWDHLFKNTEPVFKDIDIPVVIMAGGKGTRLDPLTRILPKPLIPIGDKPVIELIMDKFSRLGIRDFYLTLNYKGEMIKSFFDNNSSDYTINYIWENQFLGTAGGLSLLPDNFHETFIVTNCDILLEVDYEEVLQFHKEKQNDVTVIGSVQHIVVPYGVIEFSKNGCIEKMSEKPEFDVVINTGVYVLNKTTIRYIPPQTYIDMPDLIRAVMEDRRRVSVFPVSEKSYIDIGQWNEYKKNIETLMQ